MMKKILVIDGQGGQLGKQLCDGIRGKLPDAQVIAVGTNANATLSMIKGNGCQGATGENPVIVCSKEADMIVGPIGIINANSMLGEITPKMALAISESPAQKILIPFNRCSIQIAGVKNASMSELIEDAIKMVITKYSE